MSRVKTFDATGLATSGRVYAGDLNAIQDQYADLTNLAQSVSVGSLAIGEAGLQIIRYGPGEARISGALRTDGIMRGLGGLYPGAYTTAQRDVIPTNMAPTGLLIVNTTTGRLEINKGTDAARSWQGVDSAIAVGTLGARPAATAQNQNTLYFATDDNGGTLYASVSAAWTKISRGLTESVVALIAAGSITDAMLAGAITPSKISGTAVISSDSRLSDARPPSGPAGGFLGGTYPNPSLAANSVGASQIIDRSVGTAEIATGAVTSNEIADGSIAFGDLNGGAQGQITSRILTQIAVNSHIQAGSTVVTTNSSGIATINYPYGFPSGGDAFIGIGGEPNSGAIFICSTGAGYYDHVDIVIFNHDGTRFTNGTTRVNWIAFGH